MRPWTGALVSLSLFLAELSAAYALVPWACARGIPVVLHALIAVTLVMCIAAGVYASGGLREEARSAALVEQSHFASTLSLALSAIAVLALIAQWVALFILPICAS